MRMLTRRRLFASSALAAVLWLVAVVVRWAFSQIPGGAAQLSALVPEVVPSQLLWGESGGWLNGAILVGAVTVVLVHALITAMTGGSHAHVVSAWFATIAAGALVGLAFDVAAVWGALGDHGPRGLLVGEFGSGAASGALWGLAAGWMPGLVARVPVTASAGTGSIAKTSARRVPAWLLPTAVVAVAAVVATGVASDNARTAAIAAATAARQQAEAEVTFGALPDPNASGRPVPTAAAASENLDAQWCTADKATLLKGEPDAATGHRAIPIRLMNFSAEPCVIEGYPDVAFGDQNAHLLEVTLERGGSFMTQDTGPQRIEVPAGGYAVAFLGWDAASPHGALVTKTVHAAPTPGMQRGSWPIDLDIVAGSTVAVTAWQLDPHPFPSE